MNTDNKTVMKARILIIEDVATDAQLLKLEVLKYHPEMEIEIQNSLEQLEKTLLRFNPDVILSDYDLRSFTAFDVLELLKKLNLNIPCIIVTGVINNEEMVAKLILEGAIGFIQKKDLSHIRTGLANVLDELNTSFNSNFDKYEKKLKLLFKLRVIQHNLTKIAKEVPEMSEFNSEFSEFTSQIMSLIEENYNDLHLLKKK